MTDREWNKGISFLENAEVGSYIEHEQRVVMIENMCGGRYLCLDENNEVVGLVNESWRAMIYLRTGDLQYGSM